MSIAVRNVIMNLLGLCVVFVLVLQSLAGADEVVNKDDGSVAIGGYDTVAYFTQARAIAGKKAFSHVWQDAEWWFASAEHRDLFIKDPDRFAPRYGGFCALAMARGLKYTVDPEVWVIVSGKLYLNYSKEYGVEFAENAQQAIARADAHWAELGKGD